MARHRSGAGPRTNARRPRVGSEPPPLALDVNVIADLLVPVPGLSNHEVDISTFTQVVYMRQGYTKPAAPVSKRPARGFESLLSAPPRLPDSCAICLADFAYGERLRALPCDGEHVFHEDCLKRWLKTNPTCPCCRENVQPKPIALDPQIALEVMRNRVSSAGEVAGAVSSGSAVHGEMRSASGRTGGLPLAPTHPTSARVGVNSSVARSRARAVSERPPVAQVGALFGAGHVAIGAERVSTARHRVYSPARR